MHHLSKEQPVVGSSEELDVAAKVKCPLHGERFRPQFFVFVSQWMLKKLPSHLWTHHSEQYRKAWFEAFPPDLWPGIEELQAKGIEDAKQEEQFGRRIFV